ncbi:MAG: endopeptidase La [Bacteroidota bacterium]|nr:endopeptidase La [Bacteroidota bacterium]MEC8031098.1 endopeptidase La [Bacteroidota bacterium]MEC8286474.1 endopeptidase La [Bacteroidota bacterium]MEC8606676.1 endopeptidase La [Bacteroidota bacterium]MEC9186566.1 endopeptidase La [Bacteroidota bacterium]
MSDFFAERDWMGLTDVIETDTEFIPLISPEDEDRMNLEEVPDKLPILPLRNNVLFPGVVIPITLGRDKSIKLIQDAYKGNKIIGVVSQIDSNVEEPQYADLFKIGTVAQIIRMLKMPDGSSTIIIQGKKRLKLVEELSAEPYLVAKIEEFEEKRLKKMSKESLALFDSLKDLALNIIKNSPNIPSEAAFAIKNIESPNFLVNFISSHMNAEVDQKQKMLEEPDIHKRAQLLMKHLNKELQMLELKNDIQTRVKSDLDQQQKEFFLHQQMKEIQNQLGENPVQQEINELREKSKSKKWSKEVEKVFSKELDKLERMNPSGAEYGVQINYCQLLIDLPWGEYTSDQFNLNKVQKVLDRDHFGLDKVKERIVEYLSVLKLKGDMKSPILCLYGPPGVGKTSLGKSIAEAIGRKYVRMSLGGLHDEAEIRGHRKTYIGAMPGKLINNLKKAGTSNPVFVLDEIDKIGKSGHGDPSSALLEVLDPEQNDTFQDNFVEIEYDLSKVLFIATANDLSTIQPALRDRMEIIPINGYTIEEKVQIAKKHLIPKLVKDHGIKASDIKINQKLLEKVIMSYTNESGVRGLEKKIAKLVRIRAKEIAFEESFSISIDNEFLVKSLGPGMDPSKYSQHLMPGVVTGLAWTRTGGDILFIETSKTKGKGKLTLTGNLGDVMKESAVIALEYLKANASKFGFTQLDIDESNFHIHVPEGATPKDGPSAGVTMITALSSAILNKKVKKFLAMTGEVTLRGDVLAVGGIKEKILAAKRAGIKHILLPEANKKDVDDIKIDYLKGLDFKYVKKMEDVIHFSLN